MLAAMSDYSSTNAVAAHNAAATSDAAAPAAPLSASLVPGNPAAVVHPPATSSSLPNESNALSYPIAISHSNGVVTSQKTTENGRLEVVAPSSVADSTKSFGPLRIPQTLQQQGEAERSRIGRDNHQKRGWMPSPDRLGSAHASLESSQRSGPHGSGLEVNTRGEHNGIHTMEVDNERKESADTPATSASALVHMQPPSFLSLHLSAANSSLEHRTEEVLSPPHAHSNLSGSALDRARSALKEKFAASHAHMSRVSGRVSGAMMADVHGVGGAHSHPDISCHCLVVDDARLLANSPDRTALKVALGLAHDRPSLVSHVLGWTSIDAQDVSIVYVNNAAKLHINFVSLDALGRALSRVPFLVRCGTLAAMAWQGGAPCGPKQHELPEALQFSVLPAQPLLPNQLHASIEQMLKDANLEYTSIRVPNRTFNPPAPARGGRDQSPRVTFWVLPRNVATLRVDIERLHRKIELCGGKASVHAPNQPSLTRCRQCETLGHVDSACPQYGGMGLRLLFKSKVPFATLTALLSKSGAKAGYLNSDVNDCTPSHKVTLLFDAQSEQDEAAIEHMMAQAAPIIDEFHALLHSAPDFVRPRNRKSECRDCGSLTRQHECPFATGGRPFEARSAGRRPGAVAPSFSAAPATARAASSAAAADDKMCKGWRLRKECVRLVKGERCNFEHPADYLAPVSYCHNFESTGRCWRTACPFTHASRSAVQQGAVAALPQAAPASLTPAASTGGSAPPVATTSSPVAAAAPVAPTDTATPSPAASPPRKRKGHARSPAAALSSAANAAEPTSSSNKKPKAAAATALFQSASSIPSHSTRWADIKDDDDDEKGEEEAPTAAAAAAAAAANAQPVRQSSLSSLRSPSKLTAPRSNRRGGGPASSAKRPSTERL